MQELLEFWGTWLPRLLSGLRLSAAVTATCLLIGIPMGLILALGTQAKSRVLRILSLLIVEIGRGAPALILLQFAYFGLPTAGLALSSFASASLALAWCTGAYTSEIIRAGLDAVPAGQKEAAAAVGLTGFDALRFIILPQGMRVEMAGMVVTRQRPQTASGVMFMLIEDEFGLANVVVYTPLQERQRELVRATPFVIIRGHIDNEKSGFPNLIAEEFRRCPLPGLIEAPGGKNFG